MRNEWYLLIHSSIEYWLSNSIIELFTTWLRWHCLLDEPNNCYSFKLLPNAEAIFRFYRRFDIEHRALCLRNWCNNSDIEFPVNDGTDKIYTAENKIKFYSGLNSGAIRLVFSTNIQ